jgi:hypothetical protein
LDVVDEDVLNPGHHPEIVFEANWAIDDHRPRGNQIQGRPVSFAIQSRTDPAGGRFPAIRWAVRSWLLIPVAGAAGQ